MKLEMEAIQQDVTPEERDQASTYLSNTQNALLRETSRLSEGQWNFKPSPSRWSALEVVEHLVIVGNRVESILAELPQGPAPSPDFDAKAMDARILRSTPYPSTKFEAPPIISPTGRWTPAVALEHFRASCLSVQATLQSASELRSHIANHPVVGQVDGYQWVLLVAAHIARHTNQILELKHDGNFPLQ